jgi:hypothetical protein
MVDIFDEAVTGDYIQATDLNQIFDAWEGETDKGVPLRLTQVDSAYYHAGEFRNKNASGKHLLVQNRIGETLLSIVGDVITFGKDVTVDPGLYVDGVDIGAHVHSGDAGDAPQLTAGSYGAGTIPATAFATGAIATALAAINGVVVTKRQGGSATHWDTAGTTNYTVTNVGMQCGIVSMVVPETGFREEVITYGTEYAYNPVCWIQPARVGGGLTAAMYFQIVSYDKSGMTIRVDGTGGAITIPVMWFAVGPIA